MIEVFPAYKEELGNLIEIIPGIIFEIKLFEIVFKTCIYTVLIEIFPATREKEPIFITIEGEITWRYQDKRGNTVITDELGERIIMVYSYPKSKNNTKYIPKGGN